MADTSLNPNSLAAKAAVGVLLSALILGGFYMGVYQELATQTEGAKAQTAQLRDELNKLREARVAYLADKQKLNEKQLQQKDFNKALPEQADAASFLSAIQQVANVAGVDLKGWQPNDEQPQSFYSKIPMQLELRGKFLQIAKFAYELGRVERIINVENIELTSPKTEGEDIILQAKCLATAFRMNKAPGAPAAAPAAAPAGNGALPPGGK